MNIFRILSTGDGSLKEPNISTFLGYLLNPEEDHGLKYNFLALFLENSLGIEKNKLISKLENGNCSVQITLEKSVFCDGSCEGLEKNRRDIDILIELFEKDKKLPSDAIAVENKIKNESVVEGQLCDEYNGLKADYDDDSVEISFVYLVPEISSKAEKCFSELAECKHKKMISWKDKNDENHSVSKMLKVLLKDEADGKIDAIYNEVSHTIKSFVSYIEHDFETAYEHKEKPIYKQFKEYVETLEKGKSYTAKELKNGFLEKIGVNIDFNSLLYKSTVNCETRCYYGVNRPDNEDFNLLYNVDSEENGKLKYRVFDLASLEKSEAGKIKIWYLDENRKKTFVYAKRNKIIRYKTMTKNINNAEIAKIVRV